MNMRNRIIAAACTLAFVMLLVVMAPVTALADAAPTSVVLSDSEIVIDLAQSKYATLSASVLPVDADQDVDWSSSNRDIVRTSSSGKLTARKVGEAVVTAKSEDEASVLATCKVTVIDSDAPDSIVLNQTSVVIDLANSKYATLSAYALPADADQEINWKSSDRDIVRTSSRGKLTARKVGTATITAYAEKDNRVLATCEVTVIDSDIPERIVLSQNTITIDLAHSSKATLKATAEPAIANQRVKWKTSASSIARVSSSGVVTGRKPGTAVITATSRESSAIYAECVVNVIDTRIPESITFQGVGAELTMDRYQTLQLTPVVEPSIADPTVRWKTSKSSVVSVSSKGVLTAKRGGTATITCYSKRDSSVKAVIAVTVKQYPTPDKIELTPATTVMVLGDTLQLNPVTYPQDTKVCEYFKWKSSSSSRASVDSTGLVTAKRTGWVTITCSSMQNSRIKATRKILIVTKDSPHYIHIKNQETGALLNEQTITLNPTDTLQLATTVLPEGKDSTITWKSSRTSRATVDANGLVTAKKAGTVTITATSKVNKEVKATFKINIVNLPAPDAIQLTAPAQTIEITDTLQLTATTLPLGEKRSKEFKWSTSSSSIARVSDTGLVTPRKTGTVTITVKSARNSKVKATYVVKIIDSKLPDSVTLAESGTITIENGQKLQLNATVSPATATQTLKWTSSRTSRVTVDQNGVVTGVKSGSATISAISTYNSSRKDTVTVKVVTKSAPTALALTAKPQTVMVGKTTQLTVTPTPSSASVLGTYSSSNPKIATVDQDGVVTAHATGTAVITLTSLKNSAVKATIPIIVYDENTPGGITLSDSMIYMVKGDTDTISASIFPATAPQSVTWSSSNADVVSIAADGTLTANDIGTAVVTAKTGNGLSARCQISVTSTYVATTIPARTTTIAEISNNLKKINDIKDSAKSQIVGLAMNSKITSTESSVRQQIIDRAFEMQLFPWMTESTQPYWTSKYAYKQYTPGQVYYGLPYIQSNLDGSYDNREYNVAKAVSEGRYVNTNKGYYLLNREKLLGDMYVGCDCSSFMGISQYGINHPAAFIRTKYIVTSSYYETIDYSEMRPGDLLVMGSNHTVMFLYWVDAAQTKMMIIEQGGDGNTVICSIHDLSYYSSQGYIARRRVDFND